MDSNKDKNEIANDYYRYVAVKAVLVMVPILIVSILVVVYAWRQMGEILETRNVRYTVENEVSEITKKEINGRTVICFKQKEESGYSSEKIYEDNYEIYYNYIEKNEQPKVVYTKEGFADQITKIEFYIQEGTLSETDTVIENTENQMSETTYLIWIIIFWFWISFFMFSGVRRRY